MSKQVFQLINIQLKNIVTKITFWQLEERLFHMTKTITVLTISEWAIQMKLALKTNSLSPPKSKFPYATKAMFQVFKVLETLFMFQKVFSKSGT